MGQTLSEQSDINSLCILRLSAIGDVCHAVAMVQQIQQAMPHIKITWVIGKIEYRLLEGLPGVEFVVFDKKAGLAAYRQLRNAFSGRQFDVLLHMQVALRASLASLCIPARRKVGFDRARAKEGQWLFVNEAVAAQKHPHVLDGFLAFAEAIGVETGPPSWKMPLDKEDENWALERVGSLAPFAVIAPAASKAERNWSAEGYAAIAEHLVGRGYQVVICGGPAALDRLLADQIKEYASVELTDLVGQTQLKQLLAVIKHAHLVIAPDTGPAHMAVTMNTPVVGLYAHSNPRRTGPYTCQDYVVNHYDQHIQKHVGDEWTKLSWGARAKGDALMETISVDEVRTAVDRLLVDFYGEG